MKFREIGPQPKKETKNEMTSAVFLHTSCTHVAVLSFAPKYVDTCSTALLLCITTITANYIIRWL